MNLYNLKVMPEKSMMTKFDENLNPQKTYFLNGTVCTCPAGTHNRWCRHKEMKEYFTELGRMNSSWLFEYETHKWFFFDHDNAILKEEPARPSWRRI